MNIRKDDMVVVITGDDKAPEPRKVLRVLVDKNKIVVEGVNRVYRHLKPSGRNQQGGRLSKEMPIDVSNVMLYCEKCGRPSRVGRKIDANGQKTRYCKSCNAEMGKLGPPKPRRAAGTPKA
jgi:large subunit ribosomal protein L24